MRSLTAKVTSSKALVVSLVISLLIGAGSFSSQPVYAADLMPRRLTLSNSYGDAAGVSYQLAFTYATDDTLGSVQIQFCTDGPLPFTACTAPSGFDASIALLATQTGETGFTTLGTAPSNEIIMSRPPAAVTAGTASTYSFINMHNPSVDGPLYVRVLTFASSDASGPATDTGGLVLAINQRPTINAEVPPFLAFCIGESIAGLDCGTATEPFSDVGNLGPLVTGAAQTQMLAATNGEDGYNLWVQGGTMTSGNNTIPAMAGGASNQGTSQFGINLRANTNPVIGQNPGGPGSAAIDPAYNTPNQFRYQSGDALASIDVPDDYRKYTVSYIINVDANQPGGVYATTLTYICLGNF